MAFKIEPYSNEQIAAGERLFKAQTSFMLGVANLNQLPLTTLNEVAFAGRSNVGKSSLINAVTGQKGLAKTSNTPGRTQQLNYFNADDKIILVDLPGYGYAQAPENMVKQWQKMIFAYLQGRVNLKRVFVLIDSEQILLTEIHNVEPGSIYMNLYADQDTVKLMMAAGDIIYPASVEYYTDEHVLYHKVDAKVNMR